MSIRLKHRFFNHNNYSIQFMKFLDCVFDQHNVKRVAGSCLQKCIEKHQYQIEWMLEKYRSPIQLHTLSMSLEVMNEDMPFMCMLIVSTGMVVLLVVYGVICYFVKVIIFEQIILIFGILFLIKILDELNLRMDKYIIYKYCNKLLLPSYNSAC